MKMEITFECGLTYTGRPTFRIDGKRVSCVGELAINRSNPRISGLNNSGVAIIRWDLRSPHGLWVNSNGDIYSALVGHKSVDKHIRQC